jgi:ribonuclease HI
LTVVPVLIHADEACLGNGQERATPGGCGGLVEIRSGAHADARTRGRTGAQEELFGGIERFDYFLSEPDTTNNRMALRSAIAALDLLGPRGGPLEITFATDSNYVVLGMTKWVPAWRARGWRRKGGAIENLDLWQDLVAKAGAHSIAWRWVRGHAGHAKNEYANDLATGAAADQSDSGGLAASAFLAWLAKERAKGRYGRYDPDADLATR